jgi:hypothetical protein
MRRGAQYIWISGAVLLAGIAAQGVALSTKANLRFPARYPAVANARKIAVTGFSGTGGANFASQLESELGSARFDGAPVFTIVDENIQISRGTATAAALYGRSVGANVVIFGSVLTTFHDDKTASTQSTCVEKFERQCVRTQTSEFDCFRRTAEVIANPKAVSVVTRALVYTAQRNSATTTTWCTGQTQPDSDNALIAAAWRNIIIEIHKDLAPYNQEVKVTVLDETAGIGRPDLEQFKLAKKALKAGNIPGACQLWAELRGRNAQASSLAYNLGVCAELDQKYATASEMFSEALRLNPASKDAVAALARVKLEAPPPAIVQPPSPAPRQPPIHRRRARN